MILIGLLIYFCILAFVAVGSAAILVLLIYFLSRLAGYRLSKLNVFLLCVFTFLGTSSLVGGWFYGKHYAGLPWEKKAFKAETQQYLNNKYPQYTYRLNEPEYTCTGLFRANCSPHWIARGKLIGDVETEFLVTYERGTLQDTLGPKLLDQHFEKDRSKWESIVREVMEEPHNRIAMNVRLKKPVFDSSTEPFQLDYTDEILSVNMDVVKEMDPDAAQREADKLFHLKQELEERGMSSVFSVSYLNPSVLEVIGTAQDIQSMSKETDFMPYEYISYLMNSYTGDWKTPADALEALQERPCKYCGNKE